jgi:hypothetical protein
MASTRFSRSGMPCGSKAYWLTLAATKSIAEALGQAATQAPQPMQEAASMAFSALSCGMRIELPSTALPVLIETKPPAAWMRSKAERSTTRSFTSGKAFDRKGSTVTTAPSLYLRMWSWQVVAPLSGP